jgi:uncharacterized membrane protein
MDRAKLISFFGIAYLFLTVSTMLFSHEEHHHDDKNPKIKQQVTSPATSPSKEMEIGKDSYRKIIHWLGNFHPVLLHFPIALIVMTVISELLYHWYGTPLFEHASRFMIITAAITAIPTALFGFAFGYDAHYEGILGNLFWWHRFLGVFTTLLTIVAAILRELHTSKQWNTMKTYYICLFIIFISVNLTGYLGGGLTFGPDSLWPPFDI